MFESDVKFTDPGFIDWAELFGREMPVELELGFGKGRFLVESASNNPDVGYMGVEVSRKWFREGLSRINRDPQPNLRVCQAEALDFLSRKVRTDSIRTLHVYHPDPWPKKRHHKRRLLARPFMDQAARIIEPAGLLLITTDHLDYSLEIEDLLSNDSRFERRPWLEGTDPNTHFEAKYRKEGRPIHQFRSRLRETS
ncbi:MAG: tRNA (guanosine(46)-N7)-methyltransferase TrmB [bacterium]|nr:tRNA (guanosine(46)-N7)-methyltransferase TrmB [bacterium]